MKIKLLSTTFLCLFSVALSACGKQAQPTTSATVPPTTANTLAPTFTPNPTDTPQPTETPAPIATIPQSAASTITMNCADWALIDLAGYQAQNNTWGKGELTGWTQCIGMEAKDDGSVMGHWAWDWLNSGGNVKAYPEIVYGQKPGGPSTAPDLPIKVSEVGSITVAYDIYSTYTGGGNIAFDFWLTDTANPDTWGVPPITHEIMIWLDSYGGLAPGGQFVERITIGGVEYNVFVGKNFGGGWTYIAFDRVEHQLGIGLLNVAEFLEYIVSNDLATGDEYLASVEFGNEITGGTGETFLNMFRVTVLPK